MSKMDCLKLYLFQKLGSMSAAQRIRQGYILAKLKKLGLSGKKILDAGCGDGSYALLLVSQYPNICQIMGIDFDETRINKAVDLSNCEKNNSIIIFTLGSITNHLGDNVFDIIYCVDVLEHISDDQIVLSNFHNALRPGGILILHVPLLDQGRYFLWLKEWKQANHVRDGYNEEELTNRLDEAGFEVVTISYTFGPFGALAWEMEETCRKVWIPLRYLFLPILLLLATIDLRYRNPWGNAICITVKKEGSI